MADNWNCDGRGPHTAGETRTMRLAGRGENSSHLDLCRACWARELEWRRQRNRDLAEWARYDLPEWESAA